MPPEEMLVLKYEDRRPMIMNSKAYESLRDPHCGHQMNPDGFCPYCNSYTGDVAQKH